MIKLIITIFLLLFHASAFAGSSHGLGSNIREQMARDGEAHQAYVTSGCLPADPGSGLAIASFSCKAYVKDTSTNELFYVSEQAAITIADQTPTWLAICHDTASAVAGWSRVTATHFVYRQSATQPATPNKCLIFSKVDVATPDIDTVTNFAYRSPEDAVLKRHTVTNWGIVGDDSTNNDTGFANVLAATPDSNGPSIYIPDGIYQVTTDIGVTLANTRITGESKNAVIKMVSASNSRRVIHVSGTSADHVSISNLTIDGNFTATNGHQCIAFINGPSYGRVINVWTQNCGQYGIVAGDTGTAGSTGSEGADGHIFAFNHVDMSSSDATSNPIGIEVFPKGTTGTWVNNQGALIMGNTVLGDANVVVGIKASFQTGVRIIGNTIRDITLASATGCIDVLSDHGAVVEGNSCENADLGIVASGNLTAGSTVRLRDAVIKNNVLENIAQSGIFASEGYDGLIIEGNTIREGGGGGTRAIDLQPSNNGTNFTNHKVINNYVNGMRIDLRANGTGTHVGGEVSGNIVDTGNIAVSGDDMSVVRNTVKSSAGTGIQVSGDRAEIIANRVKDGNTGNTADIAGITVVGDDAQVRDNRIYESGSGFLKHGITLNGADNARLSGNVISGVASREIFITGTITTWTPYGGRFFVDNETTVGPGDTSENTLATVTIPQGAFTNQGGLRIKAYGDCAGVNDVKTLRLKVGGTTIGALTIASGTHEYYFEAEWWGTDATTAQSYWVKGYEDATLELGDFGTDLVDTRAGTVAVVLTGQMTNAGDTVRGRSLTVELIR